MSDRLSLLAAIRGIRRWGTGEMLRAAFEGFKALPPAPAAAPAAPLQWWFVLGVPAHASNDDVNAAYRGLAKANHPDRNAGDAAALERWHMIDTAYTAFKKERGL